MINKPRKQSKRQTIDFALLNHVGDTIREMIEDPIGSTRKSISKSIDKPTYVRGALVHSQKRNNRK